MAKRTIADVDVAGKRVLMRVDFNVPVDNGRITDESRIRKALDSIRSVVDRGGKLVLMSHLGRPEGKGHEPENSMKPCADRLGELLGREVVMAPDCVGDEVKRLADGLQAGQVLLLENLRFHKAEKKGDPELAKQLAELGDIYCNDAFGTAHRADASMVAVPQAMEGKPRVTGLLLDKEIRYLGDAIESPARPFVAVLGGAKVSDKIGAVEHLLTRVDQILIGGAMSYTFLRAENKSVGSSIVEEDRIQDARRTLDHAGHDRAELFLPRDHVCGKELAENTDTDVFEETIDEGWMGLDIGPRTVTKYGELIDSARTVVWNGPMGAFETPPFHVGTKEVAEEIARVTQDNGTTTIVGGGDSAAAVEQFGLTDRVAHVSTGGGASLEMLEGKSFESVELLDDS